MPKKINAKLKPKTVVTTEMIDKAANTTTVKDLVRLADAFSRVSLHGPFAVELPVFCAVHIGEKGYRRSNMAIGTRVQTDKISLGKKQGLIFSFKPVDVITRDGGEEAIAWFEMGWDDVINSLGAVADRIDGYLDGISVTEINTKVKAAIAANPAMHKILSEGFSLAQQHKKQEAVDESLSELPGYGSF